MKIYLDSIKLGVIDDSANRSCLAKLLQFRSTKDKAFVSFAECIERMKETGRHLLHCWFFV
jgi:heat shock protein beta